jgi:hypothetical protein
MKKTSIRAYSAKSFELPIGKTVSLPFGNCNVARHVKELLNTGQQPTEELIRHLNRIGQEYPFCVYYKQKTNDPL